MKCPIDDTPLSVSSREGVEIDFCPQCRGVWLDRGELDKIIERSAPTEAAPATPQPSAPLHQAGGAGPWDVGGYTHGGQGHGHYDPRGKPYYKKKKHWLSDLFDD
jgi:Zn-finger nucleic acid-binding protein